ncbi:MAG: hypothetical protein ABR508_12690, partial [Candidatus Baltobacteraceae bacterium]
LQDEIGTTLDERSVTEGVTSVSLQAPKSSMIVTYYLVCTSSSQSSSEEALVRPVRIFRQ